MTLLGFPKLPKLDGPDGLTASLQKVGASFLRMAELLESIDRHLDAIERNTARSADPQ